MQNDDTYKKIELLVMNKIQHTRTIRARVYGTIHGSVALISIIGFVFSAKYVYTEATVSGFSDYASLFFSDTTYSFSHLKTILLPLAESMPVLDITVAIAILLIFGNAIKRLIGNIFSANRNHGYKLA